MVFVAIGRFLAVAAVSALWSSPVRAAIDAETVFIFNSLSFLLNGILVMLMAAGFCMLETGLVRSKNAVVQSTKNISLYALAGLLFWAVGYNLMYLDVSSWIGSLAIWSPSDNVLDADSVFIAETADASASSDWFFQMVFVATVASIVSGAVAERVRLSAFLIFSGVLVALIYPIQGSWSWGGGWLAELGFVDFAGSSIVHSVGGWCALTGAVIIGARHGKFDSRGRGTVMPGSNLPLATVGTFVLWFGWFGFNGGSQLAMGSAADVIAIADIYVNTNLAAAAGVVTALILTALIYGKVDLTLVLNGALGGLVAITAEPLSPSPALAVFIGALGSALVVFAVPLLERIKIDDVVGAIPVHLIAGIWGTLAVVLSNDSASLPTQLIGIAAIGAFAASTSALVWFALKITIGVRVNARAERDGLDLELCGIHAYSGMTR